MTLFACHHDLPRVGRSNPSAPAVEANATPQLSEPVSPLRPAAAISQPPDGRRDNSPDATQSNRTDMANTLQDVFYGYDRSELTEAASATLLRDAKVLTAVLSAFPRAKIIVEGHCDERGSAEYNLALGDLRARSAADALRAHGLKNLETVTYGKENPQCSEPTEDCWQKNRRAHIVVR